jgi:phosphoribosylaminoimidazolecarboxamide formyltransferase/IMP cyclohydrolase
MAINKVVTIDDQVPVKTVLVSVFDKTGLETLVRGLLSVNPGVQILSTGGTHEAIASFLGKASAGTLRQVSDYTGQPEMQGGLVKTLDYKLYLGLLSETHNPDHQADLARANAVPIDMVVANLYPFQQTASRPGSSIEDARAYIDIGGPCMVRAAAKNYHRVAVLTDPGAYAGVVAELSGARGRLRLETRFRLAQKAFQMIAAYDEGIAKYLFAQTPEAVRGTYNVRDRV